MVYIKDWEDFCSRAEELFVADPQKVNRKRSGDGESAHAFCRLGIFSSIVTLGDSFA